MDVNDHRQSGRPFCTEDSEPIPKVEPVPLGLLSELWPGFTAELERRSDGSFDPISTGLKDLDAALGGGIPRGGVTLLPAAPGTGKTTFMLWLALDRASEGTPVIFWSLELTAVDALARLVSILEGKPWGEVRQGQHPGPVKLAGERVKDHPFAVHGGDTCPTVEDMEGLVESLTARCGKAPLVVVDYAQLLVDELAGEVRHSATALSKDIALMAGRTGAAVVAISSVGRAAYNLLDKKGTPDLDRVLGMAKESGQFEYDACSVLALVAVKEPETTEGRCKKLWAVIGKERFGCPGRMVPLEYDGLTGRFRELSPEEMPAPAVGSPRVPPDNLRESILDLVRRREDLTSGNAVIKCITGRADRTRAMIKAMLNVGELAGGTKKTPFRLVPEKIQPDLALATFREGYPDA